MQCCAEEHAQAPQATPHGHGKRLAPSARDHDCANRSGGVDVPAGGRKRSDEGARGCAHNPQKPRRPDAPGTRMLCGNEDPGVHVDATCAVQREIGVERDNVRSNPDVTSLGPQATAMQTSLESHQEVRGNRGSAADRFLRLLSNRTDKFQRPPGIIWWSATGYTKHT